MPCASLLYRQGDGDVSGVIVAVCETEAEAKAAAEVIGRALLAAYDKWEASLCEGPLVLHLDAAEILREVRASGEAVEVKAGPDCTGRKPE